MNEKKPTSHILFCIPKQTVLLFINQCIYKSLSNQKNPNKQINKKQQQRNPKNTTKNKPPHLPNPKINLRIPKMHSSCSWTVGTTKSLMLHILKCCAETIIFVPKHVVIKQNNNRKNVCCKFCFGYLILFI